ncbi:MAG: sialidase family protein, partial [bacterium]
MKHRSRLVLAMVAGLGVVSAQGQSSFIRWESANKGLDVREGTGIQSVALGGRTPVAYVAAGGGLYRSDDRGASWRRLTGKDPVLAGARWVAAAPDDGTCVFAAAEAAGGGLYRSADGGATWKRCEGLAGEDVESVAVCSQNAKVVLAGQRDGNFMSSSADGGATWIKHDMGGPVKGQVVLAMSETLWAVVGRAEDKGVRVTDNGGQTWTAAEGDVAHHGGALVVAQTGETLFTTKHHGVNKSTDGGRTWKYTMEDHSRMVGVAGRLVFREGNRALREGNRVWMLQLSDNEGVNWQEVTLNLTDAIAGHLGTLPAAFTNMSPFQENRQATAWAATPDGQTVLLGLGAAGLYRGRVMNTPRGPLLSGVSLSPAAGREGDTQSRVQIRAVASSRSDKVRKVSADLRAVGAGELELLDDGQHGDDEADDKTYGNSFTVGAGVTPGGKVIGVVAEDDKDRLSSAVASFKISAATEKTVVWDGDRYPHGLSWVSPQTPLNFIKAQTEEVHNGKVAVEFRGEGSGYIGGGWNWHGWYPEGSGEDITSFANLTFWVKVVGDDPQGLAVSLVSSTTKKGTGQVMVADYAGDDANLRDGAWHEVVIPLRDLYAAGKEAFDPRHVWELDISSWAPLKRAFSVFVDDVGFDNRMVRSRQEWATRPEPRVLTPLKNPAAVTADVDVKGAGLPINPGIYGGAMGD